MPRLLDALLAPPLLEAAAKRSLRGRRTSPEGAWFLLRRESELLRLRQELASDTWRPAVTLARKIRDPKPRVIAWVPLVDRIVHGAFSLVLEPLLLRSASEADFACRKGHGTHRAILRLVAALRSHRFALHLDIRSYFPSIDVDRLRATLARRLRDRAFLQRLDRILDAGRGLFDRPGVREFLGTPRDWPPKGRGLPLGFSTSQLLATHFDLQRFDHWVKRTLRIGGYVRYVDDLFLFADERRTLRSARSSIGAYLRDELGLRLKHPEARLLSCAGHLDALGFRLRRDAIAPLPVAARRWRGRIGDYLRGEGGFEGQDELRRCLAGAAGNMGFGAMLGAGGGKNGRWSPPNLRRPAARHLRESTHRNMACTVDDQSSSDVRYGAGASAIRKPT